MSQPPNSVYELEVILKVQHMNRNKKVSQGIYKYKSGGHFTRARVINDFLEWGVKHNFIDYRLQLKHKELSLIDKRAFI